MRVLVTGHDGYIGTVLVKRFLEAGHDVVGLDTFFYRGCNFGPEVSVVSAFADDVRDVQPVELAGFDAVVHLAALSNDPLGDLDADLTYGINLRGTVALARAAKDAGVRRFIFASSCSMYGQGTGGEALTEDAPLAPLTPYAESKVRAEEELASLADDRFITVAMRNATAYGVSPRLRLDVVLNNLAAWAHTTGHITLQSDGSSWRPIVHIRDISEATLALAEAPDGQIAHRAYNIGVDSENYQVRDLAEIVQRHAPGCDVAFAEGASPDPRSYRVDFGRFANGFPDCRLTWTADAGAQELLAAYREIGLTREMFEGRRYVRLGQIRRLREAGLVDDVLRWSASV
jgi:nucleoside-diphosphate-sugar epimerase